ncbi:MAG: hypothetical protein JO368_06295 [Acidimicrobiales bacterium]|nr:hypothetical protein [Acidimicrobiales bacterium]
MLLLTANPLFQCLRDRVRMLHDEQLAFSIPELQSHSLPKASIEQTSGRRNDPHANYVDTWHLHVSRAEHAIEGVWLKEKSIVGHH